MTPAHEQSRRRFARLVLAGLLMSVALIGAFAMDYPPATEADVWQGETRGVARRTSRRAARQVEARKGPYLTTLPTGCGATLVGAVRYYSCGARTYRPYMQGDQVIFVVESP